MNNNLLQKNILNEFNEVYGNPTFKEIAEITGIQLTRVFRLANGSKMRLDEYLIFKDLITKESPFDCELSVLILKFEKIAQRKSIEKVSNILKRNIRILELKEGHVINK